MITCQGLLICNCDDNTTGKIKKMSNENYMVVDLKEVNPFKSNRTMDITNSLIIARIRNVVENLSLLKENLRKKYWIKNQLILNKSYKIIRSLKRLSKEQINN